MAYRSWHSATTQLSAYTWVIILEYVPFTWFIYATVMMYLNVIRISVTPVKIVPSFWLYAEYNFVKFDTGE